MHSSELRKSEAAIPSRSWLYDNERLLEDGIIYTHKHKGPFHIFKPKAVGMFGSPEQQFSENIAVWRMETDTCDVKLFWGEEESEDEYPIIELTPWATQSDSSTNSLHFWDLSRAEAGVLHVNVSTGRQDLILTLPSRYPNYSRPLNISGILPRLALPGRESREEHQSSVHRSRPPTPIIAQSIRSKEYSIERYDSDKIRGRPCPRRSRVTSSRDGRAEHQGQPLMKLVSLQHICGHFVTVDTLSKWTRSKAEFLTLEECDFCRLHGEEKRKARDASDLVKGIKWHQWTSRQQRQPFDWLAHSIALAVGRRSAKRHWAKLEDGFRKYHRDRSR